MLPRSDPDWAAIRAKFPTTFQVLRRWNGYHDPTLGSGATILPPPLPIATPTEQPPAAPAAVPGEQPPPLPLGMQESAEWYISVDGQVVGPLTDSAMQKKIADGTIGDSTPVWRAGMKQWVRASESDGIRALKIEYRLKNPRHYPPANDPKFIDVVNPRF